MRRDPPSRGRRRLSNLVGVALLVALLLIGLRFARDADSVEQQRLYPRNDPWAAYLAPEAACPGGEDRSAAIAVQEHTMLCLLNWARGRRGLSPIPESSTLSLAARLKAEDIQRCGDFAHDACGKKPDDVAHEAGYAGSPFGENIYLGPLDFGRPRVAVDQWLNSDGHRENLFRPQWGEQGIALLPLRSFDGQRDVAIWVSRFGGR
jgi:uncharacterized protein YkwD